MRRLPSRHPQQLSEEKWVPRARGNARFAFTTVETESVDSDQSLDKTISKHSWRRTGRRSCCDLNVLRAEIVRNLPKANQETVQVLTLLEAGQPDSESKSKRVTLGATETRRPLTETCFRWTSWLNVLFQFLLMCLMNMERAARRACADQSARGGGKRKRKREKGSILFPSYQDTATLIKHKPHMCARKHTLVI